MTISERQKQLRYVFCLQFPSYLKSGQQHGFFMINDKAIRDFTLCVLSSISRYCFFPRFYRGGIGTKHSQMTWSSPSGSIIIQEDPWISHWKRLSLTFARTQILMCVILATEDTLETQVTSFSMVCYTAVFNNNNTLFHPIIYKK